MKSLVSVLGFLMIPAAFAADDVTITSFISESSGSQSYEVEVTREGSQYLVRTLACGRKQLSPQEQLTSEFALTGADAVETAAVFSREAVLAGDQSIRNPVAPTGLWRSLTLAYRFRVPNGSEQVGSQWIRHPIILRQGKAITLLQRIEARARKVTASVCRD
jgi:hypothetical protein